MPSLLEQLIEALRVLPGVGPKSAQRMAYHVLERERDGGRRLADALAQAVDRIGHCARCRDFSEADVCATCASGATAHYLAQLARQQGVRASRLAHGVPLGGELEYVDRGTLSHAFGTRSEVA